MRIFSLFVYYCHLEKPIISWFHLCCAKSIFNHDFFTKIDFFPEVWCIVRKKSHFQVLRRSFEANLLQTRKKSRLLLTKIEESMKVYRLYEFRSKLWELFWDFWFEVHFLNVFFPKLWGEKCPVAYQQYCIFFNLSILKYTLLDSMFFFQLHHNSYQNMQYL